MVFQPSTQSLPYPINKNLKIMHGGEAKWLIWVDNSSTEHANIYTIGEGLFTYMSLRPNHLHVRLLSRHPIKHLQLLLLLGVKERERESW